MERTQIFAKVQDILIDKYGTSDVELTEETNMVETFGLDSLDSVELVMAIETEFDIKVDDDEATEMITVKSAIDIIEKKV
jgi:acyl carrier protein